MSSSGSGWRPPFCDSRTGAAHRRRGVPCQDASGVWIRIAAGQPVQLLVVSDGHGGSRYDRSDVGSRLACEVALQAASDLLTSREARNAGLDDWQQWLAVDLPCRIVAGWRQRVLAHAEAHPRPDRAPPTVIPYGATLGLLLLTPRWWGCTGLGDWDLLRLDVEGRGELVSEEPDHPGGGEATYSLCMDGAERYFPARSCCHPIPADAAPFSLVLSTDGIRKSCGSDADFQTLAHYLSGLDPSWPDQPTPELSGALDHISAEGSGDDVSVAIGRWGPIRIGERPSGLPHGTPLIVQPVQHPSAAAAVADDVTVQARQPVGGPDHRAPVPSGTIAGRQPHRVGFRPVGVAVIVLLTAAAAAVAFGLGPRFFAGRQPLPGEPISAEQLAVLEREAQRQCQPAPSDRHAAVAHGDALRSAPAAGTAAVPLLDQELLGRISGNLSQRKGMFRDLVRVSPTPAQLRSDPRRDPLGGLIAWSALQPGLGPLAAAPRARAATPIAWLEARLGRGEPPARPAPVLPICPELAEGLRRQWQIAGMEARATRPGSGLPSR